MLPLVLDVDMGAEMLTLLLDVGIDVELIALVLDVGIMMETKLVLTLATGKLYAVDTFATVADDKLLACTELLPLLYCSAFELDDVNMDDVIGFELLLTVEQV